MKLEYKDLMQYGVQYFRLKAGYIAPIAPENECNRVDFRIDDLRLYVVCYDGLRFHYTSHYPDGAIGEIHGIAIYAGLCMDCARALRTYYDNPTVDVVCNLKTDELCHACAGHKYGTVPDDIPF